MGVLAAGPSFRGATRQVGRGSSHLLSPSCFVAPLVLLRDGPPTPHHETKPIDFVFSVLVASMAYGSSQARDRIHTTRETSQVLNPLCHSGDSETKPI